MSLPSLRVDKFSVDLAEEIQKVRKSTLTFAPEAGTQRLRDVINKGVTEEDVLAAVSSAFSAGWDKVKLYFMMGLPTETYEDLDGIFDLALKVFNTGRDIRGEGPEPDQSYRKCFFLCSQGPYAFSVVSSGYGGSAEKETGLSER